MARFWVEFEFFCFNSTLIIFYLMEEKKLNRLNSSNLSPFSSDPRILHIESMPNEKLSTFQSLKHKSRTTLSSIKFAKMQPRVEQTMQRCTAALKDAKNAVKKSKASKNKIAQKKVGNLNGHLTVYRL
jgi:hypothetical protein